jgi:hypothetical protein
MLFEIKVLLLDYLQFTDVLSLRCIKEYKLACLEYSRPMTIRHTERWKTIFPNMKTFYVRTKTTDLEHLNHCHTLELYLYNIDGEMFRSFHLKELVLIDLNYLGNGKITDQTFDYFTELEKLYIEHNHLITNAALKKLKLKELTMDNCSNITEIYMPTLIKLDLYNIDITDDSLKINTNLEYLKITFGKITDTGICYLSNLRELKLTGFNISCKGFRNLKHLTHLHISYSVSFNDESMKELRLLNLKELVIYGAKLDGYGFDYFKDLNVNIFLYEVVMNHTYIHYKQLNA